MGLLHKSLFQGEVLISETNFLAHFPRQTGYSFFLVESPAGDDIAQSRITEMLESGLDRFGFDVTSSAARIAAYQAVENTYIATFQTLGGLGLLLGTIGLGVLIVSGLSRVPKPPAIRIAFTLVTPPGLSKPGLIYFQR